MNIKVETTIKTKIVDAKTGKVVGGQTKKNLVLDSGLNAMALSNALGLTTSPAGVIGACLVGSGTTSNNISSGSTTFTQAGTTITANAGFFTAAMVGGLFKYGTGSGGTEVYITAFTDSTHVTVGTTGTVSTPTVATVWFVQRTTLDTLLFTTTTVQTNAGDCGTTFSGNAATHKRTFKIAQQGSPYTVNEIGYAPSIVSNRVCGRVVLASSDVVGTTNFYIVVISIQVTYSPGTPTTVANVGTNINTAGTIMMEFFNINIVNSNGSNGNIGNGYIDGGNPTLFFATNAYTQNAAIGTSTTTAGISALTVGAVVSWANDASKVGSCTATFTGSTTTTGQTLTGMAIGFPGFATGLDVKFTTPQTAPSGTFQPNTVWRLTFTRTLVN